MNARKHRVVVVGNGMVGHRICRSLTDHPERGTLEIVALEEAPLDVGQEARQLGLSLRGDWPFGDGQTRVSACWCRNVAKVICSRR